MLVLLYGWTIRTSTKHRVEKARWELHKDAVCCFEQILEAAPHKTAIVRPLTSISQAIQVRRTKQAGYSVFKDSSKYSSRSQEYYFLSDSKPSSDFQFLYLSTYIFSRVAIQTLKDLETRQFVYFPSSVGLFQGIQLSLVWPSLLYIF